MSSGIIVHFGTDSTCRIPVLQGAGYDVAACGSFPEFKTIVTATPADAVLFAQPDGGTSSAVTSIRQLSTAPLVIFLSGAQEDTKLLRSFDLVIEPMVRPERWLESIHQLIESTRRLMADSALIQRTSEKLRTESAELREQSRRERMRSSDLRK